MTAAQARALLYSDAFFCKGEGMSALEWEERVEQEEPLREAVALGGQRVVQAISALTWGWDRP